MGFWEKFLEVVDGILLTIIVAVIIGVLLSFPIILAFSCGFIWLSLYLLYLFIYAAIEAWLHRK